MEVEAHGGEVLADGPLVKIDKRHIGTRAKEIWGAEAKNKSPFIKGDVVPVSLSSSIL